MDHNHMHLRVEFTINEGKREDFKKLIQKMAKTVQETEPDTITYSQEWSSIKNYTSKDF